MRDISGERVAALVLVAIGVLYVVRGGSYPWGQPAEPGPGFFPMIIGGAFLCLAVALGMRAWRPVPATMPVAAPRNAAYLVALLGVYLVTLDVLGYLAGSFLLVLTACRVMGLRSWGRAALVAIVMAASTYVVFAIWFDVPLPRGAMFAGR